MELMDTYQGMHLLRADCQVRETVSFAFLYSLYSHSNYTFAKADQSKNNENYGQCFSLAAIM